MFRKKKQQAQKKKPFVQIERNIKRAEDVIKKDVNIVKKDIEHIRTECVKKLETPQSIDFFITYGWAILVIIIGISGFIWWQYFSIQAEKCEFVEGSGLLCENFDITNKSLNIEIRNLNNKTITVKQITFKSCSIKPEQKISDNDKRRISIPCNISSGRLREKLVVAYDIEDFQKHAIARLAKIVP